MLKEMSSLQFGDFVLDRRLRELRRGDTVLSIPGKAFDLLSYMAANAGRPLTKSELLDAVWPETTVEESNLTQNVFLLRKVLGSGSDGPIKTLAGRGYQFAAEITEVEAAAQPNFGRRLEDVQSLTMQATQTRVVVRHEVEEERGSGLRWPWVVLLLVVLAALGGLGWMWRQRWLDRSGGAPVQVVLAPMEGTTGDPILDRALVQALRMDLAQSPWVTLVPTSTVSARLTEMRHKPDEVMTAATAREVCERTNSQAVLSGNIAKVGQHFLLTEEASNCVDGSVLGQAKYEAVTAEGLPRAIDKLAANLRQKLGESHRSIARFSTPLFHDNTPSLEALKAFSQGTQLIREGKFTQAIGLLKTAVAADPNFASAYYNLAATYASIGDDLHLRESLLKAYSLKDTAMKPAQLAIETMYDSEYTGDMYELVRNFQSWVDMYPNSSQARSGLANAQADLGMDAEALASQLRTVELLPHSQGMLANLAMYQMKCGDLKGARATCERAIKDNLDGDGLRVRYLQLAYLLHDPALLKEQRAWEAAHPQALVVQRVETQIAMAEGRFADAHALLTRLRDLQRRQGLFGPDDEMVKFMAVDLMQAGDVEAGKKFFEQAPVDIEDGQQVLGLVYVGDIPAAQAGLRAMLAKYPKSTAEAVHWGPRTNAAIAMAQHKPAEAAALLEKTKPFDKLSIVITWHRGEAYLAAGQPVAAEKNFRSVIELARFDPPSFSIPLSWLGLGEALAAEGRKQEAIDAYQHFFTLWAHADPDALYLKQAKQEFAKLQSAP